MKQQKDPVILVTLTSNGPKVELHHWRGISAAQYHQVVRRINKAVQEERARMIFNTEKESRDVEAKVASAE